MALGFLSSLFGGRGGAAPRRRANVADDFAGLDGLFGAETSGPLPRLETTPAPTTAMPPKAPCVEAPAPIPPPKPVPPVDPFGGMPFFFADTALPRPGPVLRPSMQKAAPPSGHMGVTSSLPPQVPLPVPGTGGILTEPPKPPRTGFRIWQSPVQTREHEGARRARAGEQTRAAIADAVRAFGGFSQQTAPAPQVAVPGQAAAASVAGQGFGRPLDSEPSAIRVNDGTTPPPTGQEPFDRNTILENAGFVFRPNESGGSDWLGPDGKSVPPERLRKEITGAVRHRAAQEGWSAGRTLAELHEHRNGLPRDDKENVEVAMAILPFALAFGGGSGAATTTGAVATGSAWLSTLLGGLGLAGILSLSGDTPKKFQDEQDDAVPQSTSKEVDEERETVTVYRVESARPDPSNPDNNARILITSDGIVAIYRPDTQMLFLNFGDRRRAEAYFADKIPGTLPNPSLKSFEVPTWFLDRIRENAIDENKARVNDPKQLRPRRVDTSKADDQFGLGKIWIEELRRQIIQGTGRIKLPDPPIIE